MSQSRVSEVGSLEEAYIAFCEGAAGPLPPRRAFEDRMVFYAGAVAALNLAERGRGLEIDRDIAALAAQLASKR